MSTLAQKSRAEETRHLLIEAMCENDHALRALEVRLAEIKEKLPEFAQQQRTAAEVARLLALYSKQSEAPAAVAAVPTAAK